MSGITKPGGSIAGTAVDPAGPGGVLIDPDEITQPGGPAGAGDVLTADGLGGATWLPSTAIANFVIQMDHNQGVPGGGGVRYLRLGQNVISSVSGFRLPADGTLIGVSFQVQTISLNTYDIEILKDPSARAGAPVVIATKTLPASTLFVADRTLSAGITAATDEIGARVVRTAGAGAGLDAMSLILEFRIP